MKLGFRPILQIGQTSFNMKTFYLFLDIDGVLTTPNTNWRDFEDDAVKYLKELIEEFKPKIVIHSTWCLHSQNREMFEKLWNKHQFYYEYEWATTEFQPDRKKRIYNYIKWWGVTKYLIIDDEDHDWPRKHYVKTTWAGIREEEYKKACELIKRQLAN